MLGCALPDSSGPLESRLFLPLVVGRWDTWNSCLSALRSRHWPRFWCCFFLYPRNYNRRLWKVMLYCHVWSSIVAADEAKESPSHVASDQASSSTTVFKAPEPTLPCDSDDDRVSPFKSRRPAMFESSTDEESLLGKYYHNEQWEHYCGTHGSLHDAGT